jgi:hypothetical protein
LNPSLTDIPLRHKSWHRFTRISTSLDLGDKNPTAGATADQWWGASFVVTVRDTNQHGNY